jgi:hypothetical protein
MCRNRTPSIAPGEARPVGQIPGRERDGARGTAVRGRVFRYAIATGRAKRDPSRDLSGALAPIQERHFASITEPLAVGELLRAIDAYKGAFVARCALRVAPPGRLAVPRQRDDRLVNPKERRLCDV